jgi:hypothetical protein
MALLLVATILWGIIALNFKKTISQIPGRPDHSLPELPLNCGLKSNPSLLGDIEPGEMRWRYADTNYAKLMS